MSLASLSIDLVAKVATFEKDLKRLVQTTQKQSAEMSGALNTVSGAVKLLGTYLSADMLVGFVRNTITGIDALNDLKDATGASIENISALEDIALRNGNSFESMAGSLVKFNKVLNEATPDSDMEQTLKSIGLNAKELRDLDPAEALKKTAQALMKYADDGNRARLVQELFGKSIREAGPWLKDLAESGELNATVTTKQAEAAEEFNKQLARMGKNATDSGRAIVTQLLPAMTEMSDEFLAGMKNANGFIDAIITFGTLNPFRTQAGNIDALRTEIAGLEADKKRYEKAGSDTSGLDQALAKSRRQYQYLLDLQATAALRLSAGLDTSDAQSRRAAPKVSAPAPSKKKVSIDPDIEAGRKLALSLEAIDAQLAPDFYEKWDKLNTAYKANAITLEELTRAQADLLKQQPYEKKAVDAATKIAEERQAARIKEDAEIKAFQAEQVSAEAKFWRDIIAATPTAKLQTQRDTMMKITEGFLQGRFGDPESIEAAQQYGEVVSTELGNIGEATAKVAGDFDSLGATFSSNLEDAIVKGEDLRGVMQGLGQDILRIAVRKTLTEPLGNVVAESLKGFSFAKLLGFADGGSPPVGKVSLVGERGPELFIPKSSGKGSLVGERGPEFFVPKVAGTVIPADQTREVLGFAEGGSPPPGRVSLVGERGPELAAQEASGAVIPADLMRDLLTRQSSGADLRKLVAMLPGHAAGLDSVPYDNYVARLHKGERVLTAAEARGAKSDAQPVVVNINNTVGDVASVSTVVQGMRAVRAQIVSELARGQRFGGALA